MRDVVDRVGDEVDGDDVGVTDLRPDERHPFRDQVARARDRLEEVIGPVDLVHLAGLRVPDDDRRAVDPPGHRGLAADEPLGFELGLVVGRRQGLREVEVRFGEGPAVAPRDRDRGDVVQAAELERGGELEHVARPVDAGARHLLGGSAQVVERREVKASLDLAPGRGRPGGLDAQQRQLEIARQDVDALVVKQLACAPERGGAHDEVHLPLALEQARDEVTPDEARRAGDQRGHRRSV